MIQKLLLSAASLVLVGGTILAIDGVLGAALGDRRDLILPSNSASHYVADEFEVTARINSLGFRDREMTGMRSTRHRVAAIGDSFTFGWGVAFEQTWPKLLEQGLRASGMDSEVLNLGQSAVSPWQYARNAERAIPVLRPDLVLVAILQGDDLSQLLLAAGRPDIEDQARMAAERGWKSSFLYPSHIARVTRAAFPSRPVDIAASWRAQVEEFLPELEDKRKRKRFEMLSPRVRAMFLNGGLSPGLVVLGARLPGYFRWTLDLADPKTQRAIEDMAECLRRIHWVTAMHGGTVLVLSMPLGAYVSARKQATYRETGFALKASDLTTSAMDDAIALAAELADLPFRSVTREFRARSANEELFFRYDGHLNPAGTRAFASAVQAPVEEILRGKDGRSAPATGEPDAEPAN